MSPSSRSSSATGSGGGLFGVLRSFAGASFFLPALPMYSPRSSGRWRLKERHRVTSTCCCLRNLSRNRAKFRPYSPTRKGGATGCRRPRNASPLICCSERRAGFHHITSARQRICAEPALRERAGNRVIVIKRIQGIVDAQRPEEPIVFPAQLEIDCCRSGDEWLDVGLVVIHTAAAPVAHRRIEHDVFLPDVPGDAGVRRVA